jgi:hypothetical protein
LLNCHSANVLVGDRFSPNPGSFAGPSPATKWLFSDIFQLRRQQSSAALLASRLAAGSHSGHSAAANASSMMDQTSFNVGAARLAASAQNKRRIEQELASLESAYKRARAA